MDTPALRLTGALSDQRIHTCTSSQGHTLTLLFCHKAAVRLSVELKGEATSEENTPGRLIVDVNVKELCGC